MYCHNIFLGSYKQVAPSVSDVESWGFRKDWHGLDLLRSVSSGALLIGPSGEAAVSFRLPEGPGNVRRAAWGGPYLTMILWNDSGVTSICYTAILEMNRWVWLGSNGSRMKSIWCIGRCSCVIPSAERSGKCPYCFPGCSLALIYAARFQDGSGVPLYMWEPLLFINRPFWTAVNPLRLGWDTTPWDQCVLSWDEWNPCIIRQGKGIFKPPFEWTLYKACKSNIS